MKNECISKLVVASALLLLAIQLVGRPSVNTLSIRETKFLALDNLWTSLSTYLPRGQSEPDSTLVWVAAECGLGPDILKIIEGIKQGDATRELENVNKFSGPVLEHTIDAVQAVQSSASSIYRSDIISILVDKVPWWRIKLWQLGFSLGLWSGRLDEPSAYLTEKQIEMARNSSRIWYRRITKQIVCDAARVEKLKEMTY